jgi:asparagine synthase (glutamine-hydrolysing)
VTAPLAPLELALGFVLGHEPAAPPPGPLAGPLEALEAAVLDGLQRPPCLVSFSGGRDSSAVLAVATRVARRTGLPDPIPVTIRAVGSAAADETRWQELVTAHLGLAEWSRLEFTDELDVVGPIARRTLARHGLLWPFNAHFHAPMLEAAAGGTLLTGVGGDELFNAAISRRASAVLAGRVRPRPRDLRRVALHAAPRPLRRRWHERGLGTVHPWLTAAGSRAARRALAAHEAAEPRGLARRMAYTRRARYLAVGTASLGVLARDAGAAIAHPLLEPGVWAAVTAAAPRGGHLARSDAMESIFAGLLPRELLSRGDKAGFDELFFNEHSRALAETWTGRGLPERYVDPAALRDHWRSETPRAQSFTLLQAAWLASGD